MANYSRDIIYQMRGHLENGTRTNIIALAQGLALPHPLLEYSLRSWTICKYFKRGRRAGAERYG